MAVWGFPKSNGSLFGGPQHYKHYHTPQTEPFVPLDPYGEAHKVSGMRFRGSVREPVGP